MDDPTEGDLTELLNAAAGGARAAAARLMPLVHAELARLARHRLRGERDGHTLQPTALVHEVWLRLFGGRQEHWPSRGHFFLAAGVAMRRILVECARSRQRLKRGGGWVRQPLDPDRPGGLDVDSDLIDLDDALERLAVIDRRKAEVVTLRYFSGLGIGETAEALGVSRRTVELEWTRARAWLLARLQAPDDDEHAGY